MWKPLLIAAPFCPYKLSFFTDPVEPAFIVEICIYIFLLIVRETPVRKESLENLVPRG